MIDGLAGAKNSAGTIVFVCSKCRTIPTTRQRQSHSPRTISFGPYRPLVRSSSGRSLRRDDAAALRDAQHPIDTALGWSEWSATARSRASFCKWVFRRSIIG